MRAVCRLMAVALAGATLAGCDSWMGEKEGPRLAGERISVLDHQRRLLPDDGATAQVTLPRPEALAEWPQAGGLPNHALQHLTIADAPRRLWSVGVGKGGDARRRLLSQPVVADGKVFAIDAAATVAAVDAGSGKILWRTDLTPAHEDEGGVGGGVAYADGKLFASNGFAQVVALDAGTGAELWRRDVAGPVRSAPTVRGGRVVVISIDNQTHALAAEDGRPLWSHAGLSEIATLLGGASPAIDGNVVVVPYSSGEIYALRIENGAVLWSDAISSARRTDSIAALTDIRALPVMDRGRVYAVGNSGITLAIDLRSGERVWDREIGGMQTPWIAGEYLFLVSGDSELLAIEARTGRVRWVTPLQGWENEKERSRRIVWNGPVLAGDRLIVASSHGWALSVSPYTGEVLGREQMPGKVGIAPVLAGGTLYFLTDDATLVAYR